MIDNPVDLDIPLITLQYGQQFLTSEEKHALTLAGYGLHGRNMNVKVALLVVDVTWGFCGTDPSATLVQAVEEYSNACGPSAWLAMSKIRSLVGSARENGIPIIFTKGDGQIGYRNLDKASADKSNPWLENKEFEIVSETGYLDSDTVLTKEYPSAFFATPLASWITRLGLDGVIVCGGVTSGCVRATVVDAFSLGLSVRVAADATFDRINTSHLVSLLDMELKYAHVLNTPEIISEWTTQ
jgi:nicotinamidase-related amidase